jgi:protein SCO1/2
MVPAMSVAARNGLIAFIVAALLIGGGFVYAALVLPSMLAKGAPHAIGGPFTLIDENGAARHARDFHGRLMLVYFGYSYCADVCPTTLATIGAALAKLGPEATRVVPVFITVDPARDTPTQLKRYLANFDPRFVGLTGSAAQIEQAAGAYHVYYKKEPEAGGQYTMDHSSAIYLMARDGTYLGRFNPGIGAAEMATALKKYL